MLYSNIPEDVGQDSTKSMSSQMVSNDHFEGHLKAVTYYEAEENASDNFINFTVSRYGFCHLIF